MYLSLNQLLSASQLAVTHQATSTLTKPSVIGYLPLLRKLLESIPALQQLFSKLFRAIRHKHADTRKREKDEMVDDLIADALADPDGLRDDTAEQRGTVD